MIQMNGANYDIKFDIKKKAGRPKKYQTIEEKIKAKKEYDMDYIKKRRKNDEKFAEKLREKAKKYRDKKKINL